MIRVLGPTERVMAERLRSGGREVKMGGTGERRVHRLKPKRDSKIYVGPKGPTHKTLGTKPNGEATVLRPHREQTAPRC